jgi:hypothetical protein
LVSCNQSPRAADVQKLREYCLDVEEFSEGVAFLDQVRLQLCSLQACRCYPYTLVDSIHRARYVFFEQKLHAWIYVLVVTCAIVGDTAMCMCLCMCRHVRISGVCECCLQSTTGQQCPQGQKSYEIRGCKGSTGTGRECVQVQQGGWDLLDKLLHGSCSCQHLMEDPFLNVS